MFLHLVGHLLAGNGIAPLIPIPLNPRNEGAAGLTYSLMLIKNKMLWLSGKKDSLGHFPFNSVTVFERFLSTSSVFVLLNVG